MRLRSIGLFLLGFSCASAPVAPVAPSTPAGAKADAIPAVFPPLRLVGHRCTDGRCTCREAGDDAETDPPAAGLKRFEIRISIEGGTATFGSSTWGKGDAAGFRDSCFYVDAVAGSSQDLVFKGVATHVDRGFRPRFWLREYGPSGPHWYDIASADCDNGRGQCDSQGAKAWVSSLKSRKRGRLEPCGSAVVTGLNWETTGGQGDRDGGLFEDFTVTFNLEVKKFATKFAPGRAECVPK